MPFVEILWKEDKLAEQKLLSLVEALPLIISEHLTRIDPAHLVEPRMVDIRVIPVTKRDKINPDFYLTIFARHEDIRQSMANDFVSTLKKILDTNFNLSDDYMLELILTNRSSPYQYS